MAQLAASDIYYVFLIFRVNVNMKIIVQTFHNVHQTIKMEHLSANVLETTTPSVQKAVSVNPSKMHFARLSLISFTI